MTLTITAGDIGIEQEPVRFEPIPEEAPAEAPSQPAPVEPAKVPEPAH